MNNYDRINVPNYKEGKQNGYLCSMCGQYTSLSDSISYKGWNLVCCRCEWKMRAILKSMGVSLINEIQNVGEKHERDEENVKSDDNE